MNDQRLGQLVGAWLEESCVPANDPREGVRQVVTQTADMRQVGTGWLSRLLDEEVVPVRVPAASGRLPAEGFGMFSAVKFVVASVIVALFGGFLLAGALTTQQNDEMAPAAVTESPSPTTTEALLSGMVTEEVEPGVYRIVNDGVRDLTSYLTSVMPTRSPGILAGDDGSLWIGPGIFPLGGEAIKFPPGTEGLDHVGPDGTLWVGLWSNDGERWTEHPSPPTDPDSFDLYNLDGTIWAVWPDPLLEDEDGQVSSERRLTVAHLDGDEWRVLDEPLTVQGDVWPEFYATDDGDLLAWTWAATGSTLSRWEDGEWITDESGAGPPDDRVAPDGSLWQTYDPDWDWEGELCLNVVRFDGVRDDYFLTDTCTDSIEVGPDGSVWALARTGSADDSTWALYVITPEVAIATDRPAASVRTDLLPGVTLTVMEVQPGVFRVLNDGVRDVSPGLGDDLVVGGDGSIWYVNEARFLRLGSPSVPWPQWLKDSTLWDFAVDRHGTLWTLDGPEGNNNKPDAIRLRSYEDGSWTTHLRRVDSIGPWTIAPDGTVWAVYPAEVGGEGVVVARLAADGWEPLDGSPPGEPDGISVTRSGDVWLGREGRLWRYREGDGTWEELAVDPGGLQIGDVDSSTWLTFLPDRQIYSSAIAPNGSVWTTTDRGLYVITPEAAAGPE